MHWGVDVWLQYGFLDYREDGGGNLHRNIVS